MELNEWWQQLQEKKLIKLNPIRQQIKFFLLS